MTWSLSSRLDSTLESTAAEFLALGNLLLRGVQAFKAYGNQAGFDLVATDPHSGRALRIEVKSRWATDAHLSLDLKPEGGCDFYIYARLNRGSRYRKKNLEGPTTPTFYVIPAAAVERWPQKRSERNGTVWRQAELKKVPDLDQYRDAWHLIVDALR